MPYVAHVKQYALGHCVLGYLWHLTIQFLAIALYINIHIQFFVIALHINMDIQDQFNSAPYTVHSQHEESYKSSVLTADTVSPLSVKHLQLVNQFFSLAQQKVKIHEH